MKAKELAARFREDHTEECIRKIVYDLIIETKELARQRGVKTDSAMKSVIREIDDKWKSFASMFPGELQPGGFKAVLHQVIPSSKELYP